MQVTCKGEKRLVCSYSDQVCVGECVCMFSGPQWVIRPGNFPPRVEKGKEFIWEKIIIKRRTKSRSRTTMCPLLRVFVRCAHACVHINFVSMCVKKLFALWGRRALLSFVCVCVVVAVVGFKVKGRGAGEVMWTMQLCSQQWDFRDGVGGWGVHGPSLNHQLAKQMRRASSKSHEPHSTVPSVHHSPSPYSFTSLLLHFSPLFPK